MEDPSPHRATPPTGLTPLPDGWLERSAFTLTKRTCFTDLEKQIAELTSSLKTERQSRKSAESKITTLEEEVAEQRSTSTNLEKVVQRLLLC